MAAIFNHGAGRLTLEPSAARPAAVAVNRWRKSIQRHPDDHRLSAHGELELARRLQVCSLTAKRRLGLLVGRGLAAVDERRRQLPHSVRLHWRLAGCVMPITARRRFHATTCLLRFLSARCSSPPQREAAHTEEEKRMFRLVEALFYIGGTLLFTAQVWSVIVLAHYT